MGNEEAVGQSMQSEINPYFHIEKLRALTDTLRIQDISVDLKELVETKIKEVLTKL